MQQIDRCRFRLLKQRWLASIFNFDDEFASFFDFFCWNQLHLWSLSLGLCFLWAPHGSNKPNLQHIDFDTLGPELLRIHEIFFQQISSMHPERFRFTFHLIPPAKRRGQQNMDDQFYFRWPFFFALKQEENLCLVNQPRFQFISMMNQVRNWPRWDVDGLAVKWCLAKRIKMAQPRTPVVSCLMKIVSPKDFLFVMKYRYLVWRPPCSSGENYHRFGDVYLYKCAFELQITVYHFKFPLSYSIFCNTCSSSSLVPSHSFIFPQFCGMIFPIWLYLKINQHVQMVHFW